MVSHQLATAIAVALTATAASGAACAAEAGRVPVSGADKVTFSAVTNATPVPSPGASALLLIGSTIAFGRRSRS